MKVTNRFELAPKKVIGNRSAKGYTTNLILNIIGCGGSSGGTLSTISE